MDEEFKKRLADYFTSSELVELLDIPVEEMIDLLGETITENIEEIKDYMSCGN